MRKKLLNTKVTVKLRKSEYREEWYQKNGILPLKHTL